MGIFKKGAKAQEQKVEEVVNEGVESTAQEAMPEVAVAPVEDASIENVEAQDKKKAAKKEPEQIAIDAEMEKELRLFAEKCEKIFTEVKKDIIGQTEVVQSTIIAIIAGGNVLLEGAPGLGKTRLVRSLGNVFDLPFSRIQFTPDLMPADVTGTNIITKDENGNSKFEFQKGPIFSNIVLADEINRATRDTSQHE